MEIIVMTTYILYVEVDGKDFMCVLLNVFLVDGLLISYNVE